MSRQRLGWMMGSVGVLLIVAAVLVQQVPFAGERVASEIVLDSTPTITQSAPVASTHAPQTPSAAQAESPLVASPLAQPDSPLVSSAADNHTNNNAEAEEGLVWLPTVVADENFGPEEPGEPEEPAGAPVYEVRVVNTYPHDPAAFTQGLEFRDGELFEGTGLYGQSSLRQVDLETGEVLEQVDLEREYFGEGITVFEDRIFQLTWQSRVGFVYDRETLALTDTITYTTEGWGLTHDGTHLIMSDGTATIRFRDPDTFAVTDSIQVTDAGDLIVRLNELEYIDGEIWANVWLTDRIARIDPETGAVIAWLDLSGLLAPDERVSADAVLNGIAYDAETARIFVTGKLWPSLFEIEVIDLGEGREPVEADHAVPDFAQNNIQVNPQRMN